MDMDGAGHILALSTRIVVVLWPFIDNHWHLDVDWYRIVSVPSNVEASDSQLSGRVFITYDGHNPKTRGI